MSYLASMTQPNPSGYYFALDQPATTVVAPAFTATGAGQPNSDGRFVARGDAAAGAPALAFQMRTSGVSALQQWNIGMANAPTGVGNAGNDLIVAAYDNGSNLLSVPLAITRATGAIAMSSDVTVGYGTEVGGADLKVDGTLGVAQVYDSIYNRPVAGAEVLNNTYGPTGTLIGSVLYTPSTSGLYSVTMEVSVDTTGLAFINGTSLIVGYMGSPFPPFPVNTDSYLACDSVANPAGFVFPVTGGTTITGIYKKDIVALVNLTAGVEYAAQATFSAGINLGTTGGVRFFIQPLLA